MIHSITFKNLNRSTFEYVKKVDSKTIKVLRTSKVIKFTKGLNLIIGENGCGKSSLINMLGFYTFSNTGESKLAIGLNPDSINKFFTIDKDIPCDGINLVNDYRLKVTKLILDKERDNEDMMGSFMNFGNFYNSINLSEGEKLIYAIHNTFEKMFSNDLLFDYSALTTKQVNDVWKNYQDEIKKYITLNQVNEDEPVFTLLMDEPDRNLDINHVNEIYNVLSNQKENGQMIVSIHNPLLIYSLSKLENVNIIELTKGYKDSVVKHIETLIK